MGQLYEIIKLFVKLGFVAFGGPAAHIAMMQIEVVEKRKWMSQQHYLDLIGATNLIPGPNSTEMAMHCGFQRAGFRGLIASGLSFILPAALLTGFMGYLYYHYGSVPEVQPLLVGVRPVVLAIILKAVWKLGKKALKNFLIGVIGVMVLGLSLMGTNEVVALLAGGVIGVILLSAIKKFKKGSLPSVFPVPVLSKKFLLPILAVSVPAAVTLPKIFFVFLKVGSVLFGSGYVLVAYLEAELVQSLGWISEVQLLDAIAIGQLTPGPVLTTATFIGYQLQGFAGAFWATVGIFLPSFVFVYFLNPLIPKIRASAVASRFLDSVNIGAVAVMISAVVKLGESSLLDWKTTLIAVASCIIVFVFKSVNVLWLVAGGAAAGLILSVI